jgi:lia operon protein LiaF
MIRAKIDTFFTGLLLLGIGILFLMDNFDWIDFNLWRFFVKFWPLILIYIGLKNIILHFVDRK